MPRIDILARRTLKKNSFARTVCEFDSFSTPLRVRWSRPRVQKTARPTMSLGMEALSSYTALIHWGRYSGHDVDGWLFRIPGFEPEPCPEGAWDLECIVEAVPEVAAILASEGELVLVFVEHPTNHRMIYVYTPSGGGDWRRRNRLLSSRLGRSPAIGALFGSARPDPIGVLQRRTPLAM